MKLRLLPTLNNLDRLAELKSLRVTGWSVFDNCPHTWALQFLGGDQYKTDSKSSKIGTAAHLVVEQYARGAKGEDTTELEKAAAEAFLVVPENERENLVEYISTLANNRMSFYDKTADDKQKHKDIVNIIDVEYEFGMKIEGIGIDISGHIDMLTELDDGSILIIDHKTNRKPEGVSYWRAQMQPLIYSMAMRRKYPGRDIYFAIGYVNLGYFISWQTDPAEDEPLIRKMVDAYERMEYYDKMMQWPKKTNDNCRYCPIKETCSEHKQAQQNLLDSALGTMWPMPIGDQLIYIRSVIGVAEGIEKALIAKLTLEVDERGPVRTATHEFYKNYPNERSLPAAPVIKDLLNWIMSASEDEVSELSALLPDLITVKVGGYDKIIKKLPTLGKMLLQRLTTSKGHGRLMNRVLKPTETHTIAGTPAEGKQIQ